MQTIRMRSVGAPLRAAACAVILCLATPLMSVAQPSPQQTSPIRDNKTNSRTGQTAASAQTDASAKAAQPNRHATRGEYLARTALSYRGVPYRWGGRSARTGFDCSGLVQAVYAKWGLYLPRVARAQYKMGVPVKPNKLQPGDLVFFKNTYRHSLSHVGIYIGNGYFVHAPHTGSSVRLSLLADSYYKRHWAGARRLNLSKLPPVPGEEKKIERVIVDDSDAVTKADVPAPSAEDAGR